MAAKRICKIDGCGNPDNGKGLCGGHRVRLKRYGDPLHGGPLRKRTPRKLEVSEDHAIVPLTRGYTAKVDLEDAAAIGSNRWCVVLCNGRPYAARRKDGQFELMHRHLAQTPTHMQTDHINGDTLDNRKSNLRHCSRSQNQANRTACGVYYRADRDVWVAEVTKNGRKVYSSQHPTREMARNAYKAAKVNVFGEFART